MNSLDERRSLNNSSNTIIGMDSLYELRFLMIEKSYPLVGVSGSGGSEDIHIDKNPVKVEATLGILETWKLSRRQRLHSYIKHIVLSIMTVTSL